MSAIRKRYTAPLAIVLALAITPALAGCFGGNPVENIVEGAIGDLGGNSVPDGFPTEVPLIDGEVMLGYTLGASATDRVFTVGIKVADLSAMDTIRSQLVAAGFEDLGINTADEDVVGGVFGNESWGILVGVGKDGSNGFVATYQVSTVPKL